MVNLSFKQVTRNNVVDDLWYISVTWHPQRFVTICGSSRYLSHPCRAPIIF